MKHTFFDYYKMLFDKGLVSYCDLKDSENSTVTGICYNSSLSKEGCLFVCKGAAFKDEYLTDAINLGASFYIAEKKYPSAGEIPYIIVSDVRKALAAVSCLFFNYPSESLETFGVTGTKGKSTICLFIKRILDEYYDSIDQQPCGLISTIETFDGLTYGEAQNSTPESHELQRFMANGVACGVKAFAIEVSSQGIKQCRTDGISFGTGVFINIGYDHISPAEHSDFEDYFSTKLRLFDSCKRAVINISCEHQAQVMEKALSSVETIVTFGKTPEADVYFYDMEKKGTNTVFRCRTEAFDEVFELAVPGLFNAENAAAAIAATMHMGISPEIIRNALINTRIPGRMEMYTTKDGNLSVCIDYAHNTLSFETLIKSLREEFPGRKLIMVFGTPGGKALNRRKDLGIASGKLADFTYIASEDPNYEDPMQIALEVAAHIESVGGQYEILTNREQAITAAFKNAPSGSIIIVAGKGCESYTVVNGKTLPCRSDDEIARELVEEYDKLTV